MMIISNILEKKGANVTTISPSASIKEAITLLEKQRIGALVVVGSEMNIEGILSERDIVQMIARHGHESIELPVSDVMTRDVKTCDPEQTCDNVLEMMTQGKFRHVPITKNGKLVGIISVGDVVKRKLEELSNESEELRHYIQQS